MLGLHPLHVEMQAFNWASKVAFYQDFRDWQCNGSTYLLPYSSYHSPFHSTCKIDSSSKYRQQYFVKSQNYVIKK